MANRITVANSSTVALESIYEFFLGDYIAEGIHRSVYELRHDDTQVVKLCVGDVYQNVLEMTTWTHIEETEFARWFAPCILLSSDARVLTQRKTSPIRPDQLPKKIPSFFTDIKVENWGLLDGKPVCHDYAFNLLMERGMTSRMKIAHWD